MSTSRFWMPKLASQQKMYSSFLSANQSTSRNNRSSPNLVTLAAVAEPQSQKVQRNGQPRLVSHRPIQLSFGLAFMIESKAPSRKGDGISSRSRTRSVFGLRTNPPSGLIMLTPGSAAQASRSGKASSKFRNVRSPSLCTARSIWRWARRKASGWSGTCGPPNTITIPGFSSLRRRAISREIRPFQT